MELDQVRKVDLHHFGHKDPISEISGDIFFGLTEGDPIEPF